MELTNHCAIRVPDIIMDIIMANQTHCKHGET